MPADCKHDYLKWDRPFPLERTYKGTDNEYYAQTQLVQTRQCQKCGEAQMRVVK